MVKSILKAGIKKAAKKASGITKRKPQPRYVKTPSGMKLNPERFKQAPKAERLKQTKAAKKPGFKTGAVTGVAATYAAQKGLGMKKAKSKEKPTKKMADTAYKKQKQKQKEYRQKKGGKGNR
tara:strand:- start:28 stop:393 length:366 start_codon:yes stop_codon:yes gene_type:complete